MAIDVLLDRLRTDGAWDGAPSTVTKQQGQETEVDTSGDIVVDLLADGSIRLEGESISMDSFIAMVSAELLHGNAETQVLIRPERTGQALHLNRLCARLSQAGVRAYRIATNPVDGGEG